MKRVLGIIGGAVLLSLLWLVPIQAQQVNLYCQISGPPYVWGPCNAGNPLAVNASVSASITGFPGTTQTTGTPISVVATAGGATGTLPAGTVVVASNVGATNGAYCKLGASATTSDQLIPPNSWFGFTVGSNTQLTCITSTSTTTVNMVGGSGLPTGAGGGGGGGGSGGNVTIVGPLGQSLAAASVPVVLTAAQISTLTPLTSVAVTNVGTFATQSAITAASGAYASGSIGSGAMVDLGAIADAAATAGSTGTLSAKLRLMTTQLGTINTTLGTPFQTGGSIGNTTFAVTNAGTFAVQATLQASSATAIGTVNPTTIGNWGLAASTQNGTTPTNMMLMAGQFNTSPTTITTGNVSPFQLDNAGRLIVNVGAGGGSGGTSSTFGATFPGTGTAAGMSQGGNMVALTGTSGSLNVNITGGAGSGGTALADAATFTAGTTQLTPIGGQFTSGGATACVTAHSCMSAITADRAIFSNIADIAGTATLTGNGTTGAGSQRVTIASDNTAFSVNATLQASATTAIGKVDPNTIATWGLVAVGGAAAPTNALVGGTIYNSSPITITATQAAALQSDVNGYLKVNVQSAVGLAQGSTTSGQTGSLVMGAVTTSAPTYTTAQTSPLSLDTAGNLRVNVVTGGSGGGAVFGPTAVGSAAANPPVLFAGTANAGATGNVQVAKVTSGGVLSTDLSTVNAVTTLTGTGAVGTGAQRIAVGTDTATIAGSAPGTAGAASANVVTVQGVASMTKLLVTPDSVALPANQSVNVAQFGGVSTSTGQVAVSTAPATATNTALVVDLRPDSPGIIALGPAAVSGSVPFTYSSQYPTNATTTTPTAVTASATGTTAATAATLGATASVTNYVCGFDVTADATALATGTAVLSGTISGSLSYLYTITAVTNGTTTLSRTFNPCIPASAANTAITMTSAAAGTGGNTIVNIFGYRL